MAAAATSCFGLAKKMQTVKGNGWANVSFSDNPANPSFKLKFMIRGAGSEIAVDFSPSESSKNSEYYYAWFRLEEAYARHAEIRVTYDCDSLRGRKIELELPELSWTTLVDG